MRAFVDELQGRSLPLRLHYGGPMFRYERPSRGRSRQFTGVGIELVGASGAAADAEVLYLACAGLESVGISSYRLVVGHLGAALQLLAQLGMSEHAQGLVLDQMEPIARGRVNPDAAVARVVDLLGGPIGNGVASETAAGLPPTLADLPPEQATAIAADILGRASLPIEGGARQPAHIIQRLLAKARRPDPTDQVRAAFEFVAELHAAAAPPERLERQLRPILEKRGLSTTPLDEVMAAVGLLGAYGSLSSGLQIEVDLSLARGLRYYTGLVFEIYVDSPEGPLQLCGGGRYDDLVRALGGREAVPACGFSIGLERAKLALERHGALPRPAVPVEVLVVPVEAADHVAAVEAAQALRGRGLRVELDLRNRGPRAALKHAAGANVPLAVLIGEREREAGTVVLKHLATFAEDVVPLAGLPAAALAALGREN